MKQPQKIKEGLKTAMNRGSLQKSQSIIVKSSQNTAQNTKEAILNQEALNISKKTIIINRNKKLIPCDRTLDLAHALNSFLRFLAAMQKNYLAENPSYIARITHMATYDALTIKT